MPVFLPQRIDDELCEVLEKYHPLWINLHFNHPNEITPEVSRAVDKLTKAGLPASSTLWLPTRQAGLGQLVDRPRDLGRDLVRVVEVEVDPQRVVLLEHLAQLVVEPLRQEDRHARADPDDLDVRDLAEAAQDRFEQLRGERQAVAAGDQDVADLRRPAQVVELGLVVLRLKFWVGSPTIRDRVQYRQ